MTKHTKMEPAGPDPLPRESASGTPELGSEGGGAFGRKLSSMFRGGGAVVERLTDSLKEAASGGLLQQGLDARDRGNLAASFYLLEEAHRDEPEVDAVASAFWDAAVAYDRPDSAADAAAGLIRRQASAGSEELAAQFWIELSPLLPDALATPSALARLIPVLRERVDKADEEDQPSLRAALLHALRAIVDERNVGLNPGIAAHVAELARELDPACALKAARVALAFDDLHDGKRRRLIELVGEIDPSAAEEFGPLEPEEEEAPEPVAEPTPEAEERPDPARSHPLYTESPKHEALSDSEIEALRLRLQRIRDTPGESPEANAGESRPALEPEEEGAAATEPAADSGLAVADASIEGQDAEAVSLTTGRGPATIRFDDIEAVAVAEVQNGHGSSVQIDLVEAASSESQGARRVMRIRASDLDAATPTGEDGASESVRDWLSELLARSRAVPLPDPESALGVRLQSFESVQQYEEQVLRSYRAASAASGAPGAESNGKA